MAQAIPHFLWALAWGAILIVAFIGWGHFLLKYLADVTPSTGLAACVGLSAAIFLGGLLNLLHLVVGWLLIGFTLTGVGLAILKFAVPQNTDSSSQPVFSRARIRLWTKFLFICFLLIFSFRLASTPRIATYVRTDDEEIYLAIPVKMMNEHFVVADPYAEQRVEASVGANYFLQALVMSSLALENVQMADQYLGLVLIVLVGVALARQFDLTSAEMAAFGIFAISIPPMHLNLTFNVLPSALFLTMVLVGADRKLLAERPVTQAFLIGALAGAVTSLKSTYLPHAVGFCGLLFLLLGFAHGWKFAVRGWLVALIGALLVLIPWMIAMHETSGTYLYPVLGRGFSFTAYHEFPAPSSTPLAKIFLASASYALPLLAIIAAQLFLLRREERSTAILSLTVACFMGILATAFATGGESVRRYNFAVMMPALLLTFLQFSFARHLRPGWIIGRWLQAASVVILLLAAATMEVSPGSREAVRIWNRIETSLRGVPMDSAETRQEYASISAALPRDALVLTTLQHPYLLDHLDRHILLADWPSCASPVPGWPIHKDGEALADFLQNHSIRYLAYAYNPEENAQLDDCNRQAAHHGQMGLWLKDECDSYRLANKQYLELKKSRRTLYDDGRVFVVDLATRAP